MRTKEVSATLVAALREKGLTLATAESCTGGGVGHAVTAVPGSSAVYLGGVVSYSNDVKEHVLNVPVETLKVHGAVSYQTAAAMARGVKALIGADVAVSITGIAGPASDDTNKPVGLVYIAVSALGDTTVQEYHFSGTREAIRDQSIAEAINMVLEKL